MVTKYKKMMELFVVFNQSLFKVLLPLDTIFTFSHFSFHMKNVILELYFIGYIMDMCNLQKAGSKTGLRH